MKWNKILGVSLFVIGIIIIWQALSIGIYYASGSYSNIEDVPIGRSHSDIIHYYAEEHTDCPTNISVCETDKYDVFINCHEELEDGECQNTIRVVLSTPNRGLANYLKAQGMTIEKVGYISGEFNIDDGQPYYKWSQDVDFKERFTHGGFAMFGTILGMVITVASFYILLGNRK